MNLPVRPEVALHLLAAISTLLREFRHLLTLARRLLVWYARRSPHGRRTSRAAGAAAPATGALYTTRWLELTLDLADPRGTRAVLVRRQQVRFLVDGDVLVRDVVWGAGEQLGRYQPRGARRLAVRAEGSKRVILLDPSLRPAAGQQLTLTSRRTIRDGFREPEEYWELALERPTARVDLTVLFPAVRPPTQVWLVTGDATAAPRVLPVRYRAGGRAVVRCRLRHPTPGITYSLRWRW